MEASKAQSKAQDKSKTDNQITKTERHETWKSIGNINDLIQEETQKGETERVMGKQTETSK